ncbi:MAG: c-type cytochrome, partial [Armatimonadetes bacterium]|nr:c-type cytochrome [Armatimonadota bacterium]
ALYYSPHPHGAYESTRYLHEEVPSGALLLSLHHYGDSALVIVLGLHALRTLFVGAYRAPRELAWILGIIVLNVVLLFGITGHLLPWDQKGYHSTQVRTSFPAGVPVVGPMARELLLGDQNISALSLTRFYAMHTLLLPAVLLPLVGLHLLLARRAAAVAKEAPPPSEPVSLLQTVGVRNALACAGVIGGLVAYSAVRPAGLEFRYNPADLGYHARPDWYFLSLFQLINDLKAFPIPSWMLALGPPGLVMTLLALLPWLDRSRSADWRSRKPIVLGAGIGLVVIAGLTLRAWSLLHPNATPANSLYGHLTGGGRRELSEVEIAEGRKLFEETGCGGCHKALPEFSRGTAGPDLTGYGRHTFLGEVPGHPAVHQLSFRERYVRYVRGELRPKDAQGNQKSMMPPYPRLTDEQLDAMAAYLSQDPQRAAAAAR